MALFVHVIVNLPMQLYRSAPYAKKVYGLVNGNPRFPDAAPVLAVLDARIRALDASLSRGTAAERRAAREGVKEALGHVRNHVQGVAETASGTADLLAIRVLVESAGMSLRKVGARPRAVFAAKYGPVPGSVDLTAPTTRQRDPHEWQVSTDQQHWTSLPSTRQAKTRATGLPVGVPHYFRHRFLTRSGTTEWSDPTVMIIVK
jgi:hypothetical protein